MKIAVSALAMRADGVLDSGIARYARCLVDAFAREPRGHRFLVLTAPGFEPPDAWTEAGIETAESSGPLRHRKTLWDFFVAGGLARRAAADVFLSTAHAIPFRFDGPRVLTVHDLFTLTHPEVYSRKHGWVVGRALRWSIPRADHLLANSEHTRSEIGRVLGVSEDRVTVTHLGPAQGTPRTVPDVATVREGLGIGEGTYILTVSTVEPRKNLQRLFEAFARLPAEEDGQPLRLVVVGAPGWEQPSIWSLPARLGIADRVHFTGFVEDDALAALMRGARSFVLASIIEGFGLPVLEALRAGVPVACSRTGALPEIVGDAAATFDPTDVGAIADALAVHADEAARRRSVERGLERSRRFDWAETARKTLDAIEGLAR